MISFNALYVKCRAYASDVNNDAFFKAAINEGAKVVENELSNFLIEDTRTGNTVAGLSQIPTPENYLRAKFLYVTNSPSRYDARFVYSEDHWQRIVAFQQSVQSNLLEYAFPRIDTIELYPTPASILPYTLQYVSEFRDMQFDDYAVGTIASITNTTPLAALPYATVVGAGSPAWSNYLAGRYFQMTGDKQWYKITSVTNTTTLVLGKPYQGLSVANVPQGPDLTYTIAEMPRLPEASHILLYYYAMKEYYAGPKKDPAKYSQFAALFDKWLVWAKGTFSTRTEMGVIPSQRMLRRFNARNPNLFPMDLS